METNFQKEISSNLRGFFVTQIISMMVRNDIINKILAKERFNLKDFTLCKNKKNLNSIFNYFTNIGYLEKKKQFFSPCAHFAVRISQIFPEFHRMLENCINDIIRCH